MIQLLYALLLAGMSILLLLLSSATRKPVAIAIDRAKRRHNFRVVSITVLSNLLVLLVYNIYSIIVKSQYRFSDSNPIDPTDQLIITEKLLAASLLGFLLFLYVVICNLHVIIIDWCSVEEITQAEQKQLAERNFFDRERLKVTKDKITALKSQMRILEYILESRNEMIKSAEAEVSTLRKQYEDVNMKYDELIEYNETIRNQLQCMLEHKQEEVEEEESVWTRANLKTNITCGGFIQFPWNNQKSNKSKMEVGPEIELQTTNRSSSARHRQPIYIVDIH
ncbi:uncharacterized protein LOC124941819 [Impatiens glandulifera]|uniref:uncharacterized protein LOC124941819 n=1 Tax=Impatiens glandulifera TaxID=253017 RepID=UPI001FB1038F|nr:uncharacterized protein LOC124941819 [Impatiens glandulifera]